MGKARGSVTLRRRVIALTAAYAIALASLVASFAAAQTAAAAAAVPGGIICHTAAGQQAPSPAGQDGHLCIDSCCIGCMAPMAAVPPAPADAIPLPRTASNRIAAPVDTSGFAGARELKSHRSRAPPLTA